MGPLVAAGAILVDGGQLRRLEIRLEGLCEDHGFPVDDPLRSEFKWSPGRELWMRDGLLDGKRDQFFLDVIHHLADAGVKALAAIDDRNHPVANIPDLGSAPPTHEIDATFLLFERINRLLSEMGEDAVVINDRPSGNSRIEEENKFLANALDMWRKGTSFVGFDRIAINLLCTQSRFVRMLQCADLITSCVTAYVAGEKVWSPRIFAALKPLLYSKDGRIGGYGLKLYPNKHRNLYHWLLGDTEYHAGRATYDLPFIGRNDHPKPPELDGWRIYLQLLEVVGEERPIILTWLEQARPGALTNGTFELRFRKNYSQAHERLSHPKNFKYLSAAVRQIAGTEAVLVYSEVTRF
jgi:hypothetical protein